MSDDPPQDSLILSQPSKRLDQPLFFPDFAESELERLEARGEFTGERLFVRDRAKYDFIVTLLAEGTIPDQYIAQLCKVSRNTINGIRDREKIPVEHIKERILRTVRTGLLMAAERLVELLPAMNGRDATIAIGVLAEKMQLLSGEATQIIASAGDKVKHAAFNDLVASLPAADARVIEMGSSGGNVEQKGGAAGGWDRADGGGFGGTSDLESPVLQGANGESNGQGNNTGQADPDLLEDSDQGGRGSAEGAGVS